MTLSTLFQQEIDWLEKIIKMRIEFPEANLIDFNLELFLTSFPYHRNKRRTIPYEFSHTKPPSIETEEQSTYTGIVKKCNFEDRLLLILAMCTSIAPGIINKVIENPYYSELIKMNSNFYYLTGLSSDKKNSIVPTGRFWIYLLSGTNLNKRLEVINQLNNAKFYLINSGIVDICGIQEYEPMYGGTIIIDQTVLGSFIKK